MVDRVVKVSLVAQVSGYVAGMEQAAAATRKMSADSQARLAQQTQAFNTLGRTALVVGALAVTGVALAINKFAEFDQAMSNVNAVTQETAENMAKLRDAALEAGGRTIFTATEAANAIEELGKAGISTADILGGALDGALSLAASGQLEVARAAEITATTLKQYGLTGDQAAHVSDVLSAAAGKALGSVEDLAQGLKFVGPVAASMGVSLEETAGALALFADQGLVGEQAGTALRGVLSSLTSPSSQAAKEIERLGINLYDLKTNKFLGLENVAGQLAAAYGNLDDKSRDASLGIIFGNQQVTAARVLFGSGAEKLHQYTQEVNDAGYAARVAADRMDNLRGDIEKLGGALDTALIQTGSGANDVLRTLVQSATFIVDGVGALPTPVLAAGLAVGVFTAALALSVGVTATAIPKYVALREVFKTLPITMRGTALAVGAASAAFAVATLVIGAVIAGQARLNGLTNDFKDSLDQTTGALTRYSRDLVAKKLAEDGVFKVATDAGISQRELTDAVLEGGKALDDVNARLQAYRDTQSAVFGGATTDQAIGALRDISGSLVRSKEDLLDQKDATESSARADQDKAEALSQIAGSAGLATDEISALADQIRGFADLTLSSRDAERQFQAAIDDAAESVQKNGKSLDINTEQGRQNQAALDAIAKAAKEAAAAKYEQTGQEQDAADAIQAGRDALIAQLAQLGITGDKAQEYADQLGLIPGNVSTVIALDDTGARQTVKQFIRDISGRVIPIELAARRSGGYADGGYTGPGGKYQPAGVVHAGEFVVRSEQTAIPANRAALEYMNAGGVMRGYAGGGYVSGGGASVLNITVPVSISAGLISDRVSLAQDVTQLVTDAVRIGAVPSNWNER